MGIFDTLSDAFGNTLKDQMKSVIRPGHFEEYSLIVPGVDDEGEISGNIANGSAFYVPDGTCAVTFDNGVMENVFEDPGKYLYDDGSFSVFDGNTVRESLIDGFKERISFSGRSPSRKSISYINMREIRDIKFGTPSPVSFFCSAAHTDLYVVSRGGFCFKITDPYRFVTEFLPVTVNKCSVYDYGIKQKLSGFVLKGLKNALISLCSESPVLNLNANSTSIEKMILDSEALKQVKDSYGIKITEVSIDSADYTAESGKVLSSYAADLKENEAVLLSEKAADGFAKQAEALKALKELYDLGILTQTEYEKKKAELLNS